MTSTDVPTSHPALSDEESSRRDPGVAIPGRFWALAILLSLLTLALFTYPYTPVRENSYSDAFNSSLSEARRLVWPVVILLGSAAPLVSLWRVRLAVPLASLSFVSLLAVLPMGSSTQFSTYLSLLGVTMCGVWRRPRTSWLVAPIALVVPAVLCWSNGNVDLLLRGFINDSSGWDGKRAAETFGLYVIATLILWALALLLRFAAIHKRERKALAAETVRVRNEGVAVTERARIARDLHDVVAHRISLIAVRAETAPYSHPNLDAEARDVLESIATDARTALDELRGVLGVLHRSDEGGQRSPQPTASDIDQLIFEARNAGTDVERHGTLPPLPETLGTVAYRVVQEALTNARRHAAGQPTTIEFTHTDSSAVIGVRNPTDAATFAPGRGLTGMRERLTLVGGRLVTDVNGGQFHLIATLPLTNSTPERERAAE